MYTSPSFSLENGDYEVCMGDPLLSNKIGFIHKIDKFRLEPLRQRGYGVILPREPVRHEPVDAAFFF